jgi:hypothetical protein
MNDASLIAETRDKLVNASVKYCLATNVVLV